MPCASFRQSVIPPAPLTGDVGRGCGDASRALLFCTGFRVIDSGHRNDDAPTIPPTLRRELAPEPSHGPAVRSARRREPDMDDQTKHEIVVLGLSTLAAIPVVATIGFFAVTGLIGI